MVKAVSQTKSGSAANMGSNGTLALIRTTGISTPSMLKLTEVICRSAPVFAHPDTV